MEKKWNELLLLFGCVTWSYNCSSALLHRQTAGIHSFIHLLIVCTHLFLSSLVLIHNMYDNLDCDSVASP